MKVVVGLGNPGRQYARTRHNVGFEVVAELADRHGVESRRSRFEAEVAECVVAGHQLLLVAPQTFMNLSGRAVGSLVTFFKLPLEDVLVVCDDLHLPLGQLRIRRAGSAGGQKGLADILLRLGSREVPRLRIGISEPPGRLDPADYVLARFLKHERDPALHAVLEAADAVELWLGEGIEAAMNRFNAADAKPDPDGD